MIQLTGQRRCRVMPEQRVTNLGPILSTCYTNSPNPDIRHSRIMADDSGIITLYPERYDSNAHHNDYDIE